MNDISSDQRQGRFFLMVLIAFFGLILAINIVFVTAAIQSYPGVVNPNAYEDGLRFNDILREARERNQNAADQSAN